MNKKRIILATIIGVIALSSVGLSLAWYAFNNRVRVASINIEFGGDRDLKISTSDDLSTFKEHLNYEELTQVGAFRPVSTAFKSTWIDEKNNVPKFYDLSSRLINSNGEPSKVLATSGYYSQELYLLSDMDGYVTIDANATSIVPKDDYILSRAQELHTSDPSKSVADYIQALNRLVKAMRFSILVPSLADYSYAIVDPYKSEESPVELGGVLDNSKNLLYDSYEKDGVNYEVVYGEISNRENIAYVDGDDHDTPVSGEPSAFNAGHAANTKRFDKTLSEAAGATIAIEDSIDLQKFHYGTGLAPFHIQVEKDVPKKIILSIYIEGWDLASINSTMGSSFLANISFKIER